MKILHVASFSGNVGDNANHLGFRSWFEPLLAEPAEWLEFEIRRVFWGNAGFDDKFVALANSCDLVVFGGGNFFELWVTNSPSGTSISISNEALRNIQTPIFVHGVGVDIHQGIAPGNVERFAAFLDTLHRQGAFITVRNDGAIPNLKQIGIDPARFDIEEVPDGGFFASFGTPGIARSRRKVGVNIAGDMLEKRFPETGGYRQFVRAFARLIAEFTDRDPDLSFVLFPHIFRDLRVYNDLLDELPDRTRRNSVEVARYAAGNDAARAIFDEYTQCCVIIGMRFHANVVAMANSIPVIGLNSYMQIENLYRGMGIEQNLVDVRTSDCEMRLRDLLQKALANPVASRPADAPVQCLRSTHEPVQAKLRKWLAGAAARTGAGGSA